MIGLPRLLETDATDLERELLLSARAQGPKGGGVERTLAALGLGAGVVGTSAIASGAAVGATGSKFALFAVAAKWAAVGAVGGAVVVGTVESRWIGTVSERPPVVAVATSGRAVPTPAINVRAKAAPAAETDEEEIEPAPAVVPHPSAPAHTAPLVPQPEPPPALTPAPARSPVAERDPLLLTSEVALVDRIRTDLADHRADDALALLAVYRRQFPRGGLGPEADLLELRALVDKGDRQRAVERARRLLEADPNGPYAKRIQAIIGGPWK